GYHTSTSGPSELRDSVVSPAAYGPGMVKLVGARWGTVATVSPCITEDAGAAPDPEHPDTTRANVTRTGAAANDRRHLGGLNVCRRSTAGVSRVTMLLLAQSTSVHRMTRQEVPAPETPWFPRTPGHRTRPDEVRQGVPCGRTTHRGRHRIRFHDM